jgi:hypothetical protein
MSTLNTITVQNKSLLDTTKYTVWIAGFIQQSGGVYLSLQSNGAFVQATGNTTPFINVNSGMTIQVPNVTNYGNNRLVFTITNGAIPPAALSAVTGYTAYPFPGAPGVCPPGPYDIFEFGPNAQYDVSAVDSFGINLSFTVKNAKDTLTYGVLPSFSRKQISDAFTSFVKNDSPGCGFEQLLYTSPTGKGYPDQIAAQFSAIVSPKDWLAIKPKAKGLIGYWDKTIKAFFAKGNQLNFFLNAATVGNYSGTSDGKQYILTGPKTTSSPKGLKIVIPAADFAGNQGFIQAVRAQKTKESNEVYQAFNQIEAAIFEAISRGVALDGVKPAKTKIPANYSSDAWTNVSNWFTKHKNAYNKQPSVYDAYAKFFHYAQIKTGKSSPKNIFGMNSAKSFGMAYGFSLDESPNVGKSWSPKNNVPAKTAYNVGSGQDVTLVIGPWQ